jgi:hypothetical protein
MTVQKTNDKSIAICALCNLSNIREYLSLHRFMVLAFQPVWLAEVCVRYSESATGCRA